MLGLTLGKKKNSNEEVFADYSNVMKLEQKFSTTVAD